MESTTLAPVAFGAQSHRTAGDGMPALVIAELGQNHNGRRELAEQLIDVAAWAGADGVKVVKRDLDCELSRTGHERQYDSPHAYGETYGEHRRALELTAEDHAALRARATEHGLLFVSTACDAPSVGMMEALDVDAFKVASRDLNNGPLLETIARTGRPVLLSTGMSNLAEIDEAVNLIHQYTTDTIVMQCTSLYPTPTDQVHLRSMQTLSRRYGRLVGFSDHTKGIAITPVAVAMGACVIEKHITLDRTMKGTDHALSVEPEELRQMIENIRAVERALGRADKPVPAGVEETRAKLGRSLVAAGPLPAGVQVTESMLTLKSPGNGIGWSERWRVLGRRLMRPVAADQPLSIEDFI